LYAPLQGAFDHIGKTVDDMRFQWNTPDNTDTYIVEHPVVAHPTAAGLRGPKTNNRTLDPAVAQGLKAFREWCQTNGAPYRELVEVFGRPAVLYRDGKLDNASASVRHCIEDKDYHGPNDLVWGGGSVNCIVVKKGSRKGWGSEIWPEMMVRIGKLHVSRPAVIMWHFYSLYITYTERLYGL
jgi:hypothetical protein